MNKILLIISLILSLLACEKTNTEISELVAVDSLGWDEDSDDVFSAMSNFKVNNDELFVSMDCSLRIYDLNDFSFRKAFGTQGSAPSEFRGVGGFCFYKDSLFISDIANFRVQKFSVDEEFLSLIKTMPGNLDNFDDELFGNFPLHLKPVIHKYENNTFIEKYNLEELKLDKKHSSYFFSFKGNHIVIVGDDFDAMYRINNNEVKEIELSKTFRNLNFRSINNYYVSNDFLYLTVSQTEKKIDYTYKYDESYEFNEKFEINVYLLTIDADFNIVKREKIPKRFRSWNSLYVNDEYVLIKDTTSDIIYKLKR